MRYINLRLTYLRNPLHIELPGCRYFDINWSVRRAVNNNLSIAADVSLHRRRRLSDLKWC